MRPNVIIFTNGLSGSSVLSGLISKEGYWLGNSTIKVQYETFENDELVDLNIEVLKKSQYLWHDISDIPPPSIEKIKKISEKIWSDSFERFVQKCNSNAPWIWKDPRLCYTMFFWKSFIDLDKCRFIYMSRNLTQTWTGIVLRGKWGMPQDKLKLINDNCYKAITLFKKENQIDLYSLSFEKLIMQPETAIAELNNHLNTDLTIYDLKNVYRGNLRRPRWTKMDYLKAKLKFLYYRYILKDIIQFPRSQIISG